MAAAHSHEFEELVDRFRGGVGEITLADARRRLAANPKALLVDVREDSEWAAGHAAGATHMGRGVLERDIVGAVPDKETEIILYCGGGYRSVLAAANLKLMGYRNVHSLIGGFRGLVAAGYPMAK